MAEGFKELKCEPKKLGTNKRSHTQRFNLESKHIDLKKASRNNPNNIRALMTELEK